MINITLIEWWGPTRPPQPAHRGGAGSGHRGQRGPRIKKAKIQSPRRASRQRDSTGRRAGVARTVAPGQWAHRPRGTPVSEGVPPCRWALLVNQQALREVLARPGLKVWPETAAAKRGRSIRSQTTSDRGVVCLGNHLLNKEPQH